MYSSSEEHAVDLIPTPVLFRRNMFCFSNFFDQVFQFSDDSLIDLNFECVIAFLQLRIL